MQALLVVAHGSRRAQSNQEVIELAAQMATSLPQFQAVEAAFLELVEPSISQKITQCYQQGIHSMVIYPHFLAAGTHVVNDLPRIIEEAKQQHSGLEIKLLPHLGGFSGLSEFICQSL
jgi:sirohydrochlorin ferrochelatase